jgi:hypothetical protein
MRPRAPSGGSGGAPSTASSGSTTHGRSTNCSPKSRENNDVTPPDTSHPVPRAPLSRPLREGPPTETSDDGAIDVLSQNAGSATRRAGLPRSPASTERELAQCGAPSAGDLPPGGSACVEAAPTTVAPQPAARVVEPSLTVSLDGSLGALVRLGCWDAGSALRVWEAWEDTLDERVR